MRTVRPKILEGIVAGSDAVDVHLSRTGTRAGSISQWIVLLGHDLWLKQWFLLFTTKSGKAL